MEIFAGDKITVELLVKRVSETVEGMEYDVGNPKGYTTITIKEDQIIDVKPFDK